MLTFTFIALILGICWAVNFAVIMKVINVKYSNTLKGISFYLMPVLSYVFVGLQTTLEILGWCVLVNIITFGLLYFTGTPTKKDRVKHYLTTLWKQITFNLI